MNDNQTQNLPEPKNEIVVYQPDETIRLAVRLENETVWLTQSQLCELFQRDVSVISRHIKNIFSEGELDKESNLHYLQIATSDRPVALYSLDVIISVSEARRPLQRSVPRSIPDHRRQGALPHRRVSQGSRQKVLRLHEARPRRNPPHQENGFRHVVNQVGGRSLSISFAAKNAKFAKVLGWGEG